MILKAKLGIAPIAWSNDDLPQLGVIHRYRLAWQRVAKQDFQGLKQAGNFR